MTPEQDRPDDLERFVERLPRHEPGDALWTRIEHSLREEQRAARDAQTDPGIIERLARLFRVRGRTVVVSAVMLLVGVAMSWLLLSDYTLRQDERLAAEESDEMLLDAESDIRQAIFYYERAIDKLTVLAERSEDQLDPKFVALQKDKIELLRASIAECKAAMRINGANPDVQHYLFAAYTDLQQTLQHMVSRAQ